MKRLNTFGGGGRFLSSYSHSENFNQYPQGSIVKSAFTLAEVLITLGIIGVVAALTLPSLIANYKNKEYATRAKHTYSLISQAIQKYQADAGVAGDVSGLFDTSKTSEEVLLNFSKYFDGAKICLNQSGNCGKFRYPILFSSVVYDEDNIAKSSTISPPLMIMKDGSIIRVIQYDNCVRHKSGPLQNDDGTVKRDEDGNIVIGSWTTYYCGEIIFDTNGVSGPNQYGADIFLLTVFHDAHFEGSKSYGWDSLKAILSGNDPVYTKYTAGSIKE